MKENIRRVGAKTIAPFAIPTLIRVGVKFPLKFSCGWLKNDLKAEMTMCKEILHAIQCSFDSPNGRVSHMRRYARIGMADIIACGSIAPIDATTGGLKPAFDNSTDTELQRVASACLRCFIGAFTMYGFGGRRGSRW